MASGKRTRKRSDERAGMSFLRGLFGGGGGANKPTKAADPVEYKGYLIRPAPFKNNGQYQTAGAIEREIEGVRREHKFIRADAYASYDDALTFTVNKARQIIDLQGDRIFN